MTAEEIILVRASWTKISQNADAVALMFYDRLFELDPAARPLFATSNLIEQRRKLVRALAMVVQGLHHLEGLIPTLADLGRRHAQFGVTEAQYASVGAALLWTLEQTLGPQWTPAVKVAWASAYAALARVMKDAAGTSRRS